MNRVLLSIAFLLSASPAIAQSPTWSVDIAPVLYNNCVSCHRTGGIAPFELMTYQGAVTNAFGMKSATQKKIMPPWPPDPTYSRLAHERLLSQEDIDKIAAWADAGAPAGDLSKAPPQPTFSNSGDIQGTPDLVAKIPTYTSAAVNGDIYQCFVIPSGLSATKYIAALEAVPGDRSIVHHVLIYADTTGTCAHLDALDPAPGYTNFGGVGTDKAIMLGGWVPGTAPLIFPAGFGVQLPKNADIVLQIHYPGGTAGKVDSTQVRFFFSNASNVRNVHIDPILNHLLNISPTLFIPANQTKTFTEHQLIPIDATLLGIAPHMHLLGKNITTFGVTSTGDTQKYIRINNWDFHWQGFYLMRRMVKIPAFTTGYSVALYDNTNANLSNPNSPPKDVSAGEATTDEMMINYFIWTPYKAGDENIVIDSTFPVSIKTQGPLYGSIELFEPYPNPAAQEVTIKFYLQQEDNATLALYDLTGRMVRQWIKDGKVTQGYHATAYNLSGLPPGSYVIRLTTSEKSLTQKLVIQ